MADAKVLIADKMSPKAAEIFKERGLDVDVKPGMSPEDLKACIGEYHGLAVRSSTKVTPDVLDAAPNLRVIGRAGIGVDNIDVNAATARGVVVMNTPFGNSITTAEHAIALMMALARQIPQANQSTHAGKWEKSKFLGVELMGKTLGVIGCGNIGSIVIDRAQGLKMKVLGYDPFLSPERAEDLGIEKVELEDLFKRSEFITLHTPLTDQTRNIIDKEALAIMKDGVRIVNCARGGLVVEEDLKDALESGKVAGAALDVFAEKPAKKNPLFGMDNVVATPHLGASTMEAQEKVALQIAEQMSDYLLTGAVVNALNMPAVTAEEAPKLKPYMALAEQLGSFAGQVLETGLTAVTIEYAGHVAELNTKPLTAAALNGLLRPMLDTVNMVSAPVIAKERDINVTEVRHESVEEYQTLIRVNVTTEQSERSVAGTLVHGDIPRIVMVKDIDVETGLSKHMLYVENRDEPGFIGALGTTLGEAGVNIATFNLGRSGPGKDAIALIEVDEDITDDVLTRVRALPQVVRAKELSF